MPSKAADVAGQKMCPKCRQYLPVDWRGGDCPHCNNESETVDVGKEGEVVSETKWSLEGSKLPDSVKERIAARVRNIQFHKKQAQASLEETMEMIRQVRETLKGLGVENRSLEELDMNLENVQREFSSSKVGALLEPPGSPLDPAAPAQEAPTDLNGEGQPDDLTPTYYPEGQQEQKMTAPPDPTAAAQQYIQDNSLESSQFVTTVGKATTVLWEDFVAWAKSKGFWGHDQAVIDSFNQIFDQLSTDIGKQVIPRQ